MSYLVYKPQLTLSKEAEQMRTVYYVNRKRGFYDSDKTDSSGSGKSGGNSKLIGEYNSLEHFDGRVDRVTRSSEIVKRENTRNHEVQSTSNDSRDENKARWSNFQDHIRSNRGGVHNFVSFSGKSDENELYHFGSADEHFISANGDTIKSFTSAGNETPNNVKEESAEDIEMTYGSGDDAEMFVGLEETYGVVYCWGENEQGKQQQPCIITVTPAGMRIFLS